MSTEYYNSQWQMPNEVNKSKQSNYSMNFDGGIQCVTASNFSGLANKNSGSFSLWFKTTNTTTNAGKCIFSIPYSSSGNGFDVYINNSTSLVSYLKTTTFTTTTTSTITYGDGNWHHVAVVYDGSTHKIYFDTVDVTNTSTQTPSGAISASTVNTVEIGRFGTSYQNEFNGQIYGVSIFDYALSASQITTLYGSSSTGVGDPMSLSPAPKAYYKLSDSVWNGSSYITPNNAVQDYVFDFTSDYIETEGVGDILGNGCTNFTTAFWFNHDQTPSTSGLYEFDVSPTTAGTGKHGIRLLSDTRFEVVYTGTLNGAAHYGRSRYNMPSGLNIWTHLVVSFDGTNNTAIYVNGQPATLYQQYTATPDSVDFAETSVDIGIYNTNNSIYRYDGKISNFQVFNSSLTATEIETLYNYGSPIQTLANIPQNSNLKAWYKLDASEVYNSSTTEWEIYNNAGYEKTYSFNGSSNIQIPNDSSIQTSAWTIGFWVKGFGQNGTYLFNNSPNGWNIKSSGNDIGVYVGSNQASPVKSATNALNGKWNYVVFSYDGSNVRGSLNGGYFGYNGRGGQTYDSSNLFIGSYSDGTNGFIGEIGQILFCNTRKGNDEGWNDITKKPITSLPTPQSGPSPGNNTGTDNVVSWWKLDTAIITDSFGSNTGINNGAILSDTIIGRPNVIGDGDSSGMSRSNLVQSDLSRVFNNRTLAFHGGYLGGGGLRATTHSGLLNPSGSSFSLSIWFRNVSSSYGGILSKRDGAGSTHFPPTSFGMFKDDNSGSYSGISAYAQKLVFVFTEASGSYDATNSIGSAETIQTNKWYNVVVTHTPGNTKMYLNGSVDSESTSITKSSFPDDYFTLSGCFTNGLNWRGALSNLSFFDTVLSASEIREIWNNGLPGDLNQHSKVNQLKDWIGIGSNYSGFGSSNTCLINYKKAPNMYGTIGALYSSTWNTIGTTGFGDFTGTSSGFTIPSTTVTNIVTNAPYSDKNAVSVNMWNQYSASQPNTNITSGISDSTPQAT